MFVQGIHGYISHIGVVEYRCPIRYACKFFLYLNVMKVFNDKTFGFFSGNKICNDYRAYPSLVFEFCMWINNLFGTTGRMDMLTLAVNS